MRRSGGGITSKLDDEMMLRRYLESVDAQAHGMTGGDYIYRKANEADWRLSDGTPWEEVVILKATSEQLAQNLRMRGIWTAQDVYDQPEQTQSAIMATYGLDYHTLLKIAHQEVKKDGN